MKGQILSLLQKRRETMDNNGIALLHEALRIMTEEQKAKLLDSFVQLSRQAQFEQRLEEFDRAEQLKGFGKINYF